MKQIFIHKIILKKIFSFVLILIFSLGILYSQEIDNSENSATETQIVQQENDTSEIVDEKTILLTSASFIDSSKDNVPPILLL